MKRNLLKSGVIIGILIVLLSTSMTPLLWAQNHEAKQEKNTERIMPQDIKKTSVSLSVFSKTGQVSHNVELSPDDAMEIYTQFEALKKEMAENPLSETTQLLRQNVVELLEEKGVLPASTTKDELLSLLLPPVSQSRNKGGNTNPFASRASERMCTFISQGSGIVLPIIILPRFIPIFLTPIPRAFIRWNVNEGFTSCGGLRSGTGFIAYGPQKGVALGFWGVGLTFSLPPLMNMYGLIGYALYASVNAENIEYYPPNNPPEIGQTDPADTQQMVPVDLSELRFKLHDSDNDLMSYTIATEPDIGSGSGGLKPNGIYTIPISGLDSLTKYTWSIQVTDGMDTIQKTLTFTTEPTAPIISEVTPHDESVEVSASLSSLSFTLTDYQNDAMQYSVETVPNIGSGSGSGVHNGNYIIPISGLVESTAYYWYLNVTDGTQRTRKLFSFETQYPSSFDPFTYGWKHRKELTIDHTKVAGTLSNFPVLVSITDENLRDKAQSDGDDILFMSTTGNAKKYYHEIETFEKTSGKLIAWVNITQVSATEDTTFFMYYGNANCLSKENIPDTWDDYYVGVWHMSDTLGNICDSTGTQNGIVTGSPLYRQPGKGTMGYSVYLPGELDNFITVTNEKYKTNAEDYTMEAWVNIPENRNLYEEIFYLGVQGSFYPTKSIAKCRRDASFEGGRAFVRHFSSINPPYPWASDTTLHVGSWYYHVGRAEINTALDLFIDGVKISSSIDIPGPADISGSDFVAYIGRGGTYNQYDTCAKMYMDEIRFSKGIARSNEWIATEYNNQNMPSAFLFVGPEQPGP